VRGGTLRTARFYVWSNDMPKPTDQRRERFSRDELEELEGEVLPQRAATSIVDPQMATRLVGGLAAAASSHAAPADPAAASHAAPAGPANADTPDAPVDEA
jgi:hypothetical protein